MHLLKQWINLKVLNCIQWIYEKINSELNCMKWIDENFQFEGQLILSTTFHSEQLTEAVSTGEKQN